MSDLQVSNLPEDLDQRLRRSAQRHHRTISDIVQVAIERELDRQEWHERLAQRPVTDLGAAAAALLEEERREKP